MGVGVSGTFGRKQKGAACRKHKSLKQWATHARGTTATRSNTTGSYAASRKITFKQSPKLCGQPQDTTCFHTFANNEIPRLVHITNALVLPSHPSPTKENRNEAPP
jgi:hypothetical protein